MKTAADAALRKLNLKVSRFDQFQVLLHKSAAYEHLSQKIALSQALPQGGALMPRLLESKSQLGQDLFAFAQRGCKTNGFFVEFGATNGVHLSNSYLLEQLGWRGILAEPARSWHAALKTNRRCAIETRCVWRDSVSELAFLEAVDAEFSTLAAYKSKDRNQRTQAVSYKVKTISLLDLLREHDAPQMIDYLSIDTEGSELQILQAFDFSRYNIGIITCEHNYTADRDEIKALLEAHGFDRKYEEYSQFDDWYVRRPRA
ncbi:MAG TPA: FkbM family methyltransferase [Steroidobacteraceae bacterium]|jgi:FkbM family methyltransferase|nr:FkbM family methyltransferase [Steroidobacteraceae bacterium]